MQPEITRAEARKILKRHRGAASRVAVQLGVSPVTVGLVLRGRSTSARILAALINRATELLAAETEVAA